MCGIVYVKRHDGKPAARSIRKRYHAQKARGSDGFGYVAINDDYIVSVVRAETEHEIMQKLEKETAPEILFHHRFPTSGPNVEEMAHPIYVSNPKQLDYNYLIVHNGVITNSKERKTAHESAGFRYHTELVEGYQSTKTRRMYLGSYSKFNDSESLAIDTAISLEKGTRILSRGSSAVVGIKIDGNGKVAERFFYRNGGNPLYLKKGAELTSLTSAFGGKEVPKLYIMRFNKEHEMEENPDKLWTPEVYEVAPTRSVSGVTTLYGGDDDREYGHDYSQWPLDAEGILDMGKHLGGDVRMPSKRITTVIPPATPPITLPPPQPPKIETLATKTEARTLNFEDSHGAPSEQIIDVPKLKRTLKACTLETLWDEYQKVTDILLELMVVGEKMDASSKEGDGARSIGQIIKTRRTLQTSIDRNKIYQGLVEDEITEREVFEGKVRQLSGDGN